MQAQREQSDEKTIQKLQRQVDELTTANLLLQDQLARKEQFIAMIAHELRSPLSPIINYAQMLARQASMPPKKERDASQRSGTVLRHTNIIISQARRLSRLVNDLLDASRLTSGQFTLLRENCDIVALAGETVDQLRPVAPYHTLVLDAPDTAVSSKWDGGRLQQALGNLLDNAIKYSDEGSTITISIKVSEESVHVSVHNQGPTIASAETSLLFRPYMRLSAASTRQGSGLGLYITKSIIEAHGGTLQLEPHTEEASSERPQGTTFSFDLPLMTSQASS
ncbi:MAG TPA: HAMP domain-containing sensor histidine kinase [Ktedonosporobacter sp.]|nr:HAMP domain-containing sensor histidine kinase [Ktedonosporobacter sp.]